MGNGEDHPPAAPPGRSGQRFSWARVATLTGAVVAGLGVGLYLGSRASEVPPGQPSPRAGPTAGPTSPSPPAITLAPSPTSRPNRPPKVSAIQATHFRPVTVYSVEARDPDGDELTYVWRKSAERPCGTFISSEGNIATWSHPEPPCPKEKVHPGTITVVVSDGEGHRVRAVYPFGSASGVGPASH